MWLSLMKPITLLAGQPLDFAADLGLHDALPASAQIEHGRGLAGLGEAPLANRERVLEHDEDTVLAERGLCLGRTAASGAGERPHDRVRDRRRELALGRSALGGHRRALDMTPVDDDLRRVRRTFVNGSRSMVAQTTDASADGRRGRARELRPHPRAPPAATRSSPQRSQSAWTRFSPNPAARIRALAERPRRRGPGPRPPGAPSCR